ncbi:MAG: N-acetylmuramoyl-L-alanine amidase [Rickettsiales bacterium]|nr:N-acetylmuramoyl-L-alanine amidase [Rickettsiales bacterium]
MLLFSFIKNKNPKAFYLAFFVFLLFISHSFAATTNIKKISFDSNNNLDISIDNKSDFKVFLVKDPWRLVVDVGSSQIDKAAQNPKLPNFITSFKSRVENNTTRIVFGLKDEIDIVSSKYEKTSDQKYGKIITILSGVKKKSPATNTIDTNINDFILSKVEEFDQNQIQELVIEKTLETSYQKPNKTTHKKPVIVIDAGHGGKDPGAIGRYLKSKEKNITLSFARELAKQLNNTKKYKVYLTRHKDFFIPLRDRVSIARKKNADIFISLHANSAKNHKAKGFSIYTLSENSSDKQAERLARKENRADIIHGVNFSGASQDIMKTLIDLSQRESMNSSAKFANIAIRSIKKSGIDILQNTHRFAGFAVLTAPDMASVLIELGYLTNNAEEKALNSLQYKRKVSKSLVTAINEYFK